MADPKFEPLTVTCVTPGVPVVVDTLVITGAGPVGGGDVTVTKIEADARVFPRPVHTASVVVPTPTAVAVRGAIKGSVPWAFAAS